jgi:hypothetical protein
MTVAMIRYQVVDMYLGLLSKRLNGIFYQMILCTFYDLGSVADLDEPSRRCRFSQSCASRWRPCSEVIKLLSSVSSPFHCTST